MIDALEKNMEYVWHTAPIAAKNGVWAGIYSSQSCGHLPEITFENIMANL